MDRLLTDEEKALYMCIFCETFDYPEYDDNVAIDPYIKAMVIYAKLYKALDNEIPWWKTLRKECWYKITVDWDWFFCKYTRICKEQILYKVLFNELKYCDYDGYKIKVEKIGEGLELV